MVAGRRADRGVRRRGRAATILILVGLAFLLLPVPRRWDPRGEEVSVEAYAELARFADARTRGEIEAALRLIDPEGRLAPHFVLDDAAMEIRPGGEAPAVRVRLRTGRAPVATRPYRRIAIDPGHFGGAWSQLEKRHVTRAGGGPVREGDLAWATARLLERELRDTGAEVRLLRGPPPAVAYPGGTEGDASGFDPVSEAGFRLAERAPPGGPWLPSFRALGLWRERSRLVEDGPFELYLRYDLRRRAAAAAAYAPDVTLSIHYDFTESDANGVLVFMPGNFLGEDFATASQRFWAFRRALDGTLDETRRLASAMGAALMRRLDLPALSAGHDSETGRFWRPVDPERGVYARNLAILRRTPGIVLLLEGPCVNQTREYQRLQGTEVEVDGRRYPARVREYAEAVLEGLRAARGAGAGPAR